MLRPPHVGIRLQDRNTRSCPDSPSIVRFIWRDVRSPGEADELPPTTQIVPFAGTRLHDVELVIVVTIIGIISAIAVPRMSAASSTATGNALKLTMANVRKAVDVFYAEHGRYPGYDPASGAASGEFFVDQLITYSDATGNTSATYAYPFIYGPYIRSPFPTNPTNHLRNVPVKTSARAPHPHSLSRRGVLRFAPARLAIRREKPRRLTLG